MAEKNSWVGSMVPLALALASLVSMLLSQEGDLHSGRPASDAEGKNPSTPFNNKETASFSIPLWDDPMKALASRDKLERKDVDKVDDLLQEATDQDYQPIILGVMLPDGDDAWTAEERRRVRYAVQSALRAAQYTPNYITDLNLLDLTGFIKSQTDAILASIGTQAAQPASSTISAQKDATGTFSLRATIAKVSAAYFALNDPHSKEPAGGDWLVPYEWHFEYLPPGTTETRLHANMRPVLVLWLSRKEVNSYDNNALHTLALLAQKFPGAKAALFGPVSSSDLIMLPDLQAYYDWNDWNNQVGVNSLAAVPIYSYWATAANDELEAEWRDQKRSLWHQGTTFSFQDWMTRFQVHRIGATDAELSQALVRELSRRKIPLVQDQTTNADASRIVLLTEWDSFYSRALTDSFGQKLRLNAQAMAQQGQPIQIDDFPYLSELEINDESLAEGKKGTSTPASPSEGLKGPVAPDLSPRPQGAAQLDYLARLAERIGQLEGGSKVRAVGIFGYNVFDKISILKALRKKFPGALFFTTDMDADMLERDNRRFTRNLMVASAFGLNPPDASEFASAELGRSGWTTPFRSTYQTGLFYSILSGMYDLGALGRNSHEWGLMPDPADPAKVVLRIPTKPRIFEIGSSTAVDLSPDQVGTPFISTSGKYEKVAIGTIFAMFSLGLAWWLNTRLRVYRAEVLQPREATSKSADSPAPEFPRKWSLPERVLAGRNAIFIWPVLWCLLCFAFFEVFYFLICANAADWQGEPWSLTEGVSLWPTEALRVAAIFLSFYFMGMVWIRLETIKLRLRRRFGLEYSPGLPPSKAAACVESQKRPSYWQRMRIHCQNFKQRLVCRRNGEDDADFGITDQGAVTAWEKFNCDVLGWKRFWLHTFPLGLVLGFMVYYLVKRFDEPYVPVRGTFIQNFNGDLMAICSMVLVLLLVMVGWVTLRTVQLIREICLTKNSWPERTYWQILRESRDAMSGTRPGFSLGGIAKDDLAWLRLFDPLYDIRFVAELTEFTSEFILYPFVVLMVVLVSRLSFLNQFDWTPLYALFVLIGFGIALVLAVAMRTAAEKSRRRAIQIFERLAESYSAALAAKIGSALHRNDESDELIKNRREFAQRAAEEIRNLQSGAFSPWAQNPVIWAIITPLTGVGGINFLQYILQGHS